MGARYSGFAHMCESLWTEPLGRERQRERQDGVLPETETLAETLSAGPAEGGGVLASLEGEVMALDGGAAPA